jgi:hypothetical protein
MLNGLVYLDPDFALPTTKLGNPVTITASRYATPLPAMILRRVIEIKHARLGVGATTKITQIRFGQEGSNLAGEHREGQLAALQLRCRADKMESPLASSVYQLVKTFRRQEAIKPSKKIIADLSAGDKRQQYLLPSLPKFQYALQCLRAARMKHIQRQISRNVRLYQPVGRIRPSPQKLDPRSRGRDQRVSEIDRGMSAHKNKFRTTSPGIYGGFGHVQTLMPKLSFDKLLPLIQIVTVK